MPGAQADFRVVIDGEDRTKEAFSGVQNSARQLASLLGSAAIFGGLKAGLGATVQASNELQNSMLGLSTVSRAFGQDADATTVAAQSLAQDGLMSVRESAEGLKNLLATGFNLEQATQLMNSFKDAAAFNRQGTLGFGEAIIGATQGIKNQNSILVDNVGISKNLSNILKEQGLSVNDLSNVTSDASTRQKLYNGLMKEGSTFSGDASRASQTLSGQQAQLSTAFFNVKAQIGQLVGAGLAPLLSNITQLLTANPQLVSALLLSGAVAIGAVAGIVALQGALAGLTVSAIVAAAPLVLLAGVLGVGLFMAMRQVQDKMKEQTAGMTKNAAAVSTTADQTKELTKQQKDLAEKMADINRNIDKENQSFTQALAEMIKSHLEKKTELERQLGEENKSFAEAADEKVRKFRESMLDMTVSHQRKVDDITLDLQQEEERFAEANSKKLEDYTEKINLERQAGTEVGQLKADDLQRQLDQELAAEKKTHEEKVAELNLRLARENEDYTAQSQRLQTQNEEDTAKEKQQHQIRVEDYTEKLGTENAFLQKHATDVDAVRGVILMDELEKLRQSHDESIRSYQDQARKAQEQAGSIGNAFGGAVGPEQQAQARAAGAQMGAGMMDAFKNAFGAVWEDWKNTLKDSWTGIISFFKTGSVSGDITGGNWGTSLDSLFKGMTGGKSRASGGPVNAGMLYQVNENGPEYFRPNTSGWIGGGSGGGGGTQVIIQGDLVVDSEERQQRLVQQLSYLLGRQGQLAANGAI